jgi:hypothetical protein
MLSIRQHSSKPVPTPQPVPFFDRRYRHHLLLADLLTLIQAQRFIRHNKD